MCARVRDRARCAGLGGVRRAVRARGRRRGIHLQLHDQLARAPRRGASAWRTHRARGGHCRVRGPHAMAAAAVREPAYAAARAPAGASRPGAGRRAVAVRRVWIREDGRDLAQRAGPGGHALRRGYYAYASARELAVHSARAQRHGARQRLRDVFPWPCHGLLVCQGLSGDHARAGRHRRAAPRR